MTTGLWPLQERAERMLTIRRGLVGGTAAAALGGFFILVSAFGGDRESTLALVFGLVLVVLGASGVGWARRLARE